MHKHDLDLIAEYAGGALSDESEARALVESCETCATEYNRQRAVIDGLAGAGTAAMTEHEKAALHRELWTELRSGSAAAAAPVAGGWRRSLAFGAAAVVFVGVGLFGILSNMNRDAQVAETFSEIASALDGDSAGGADRGAASEESPDPALEAPGYLSDSYSDTPYLQIARQVRQDAAVDEETLDESAQEALNCLEDAGLSSHRIVEGYESLTDLLIAVPVDAELATAPVSFVDSETCTVVHVED